VRSELHRNRRPLAFYVVCCGMLMVVLDTTIVTVALPSMVVDLHLPGVALTWMLNAYMLTFGGFLLLSGRLGDLFGPRRVFLTGIGAFTLASLVCGISRNEALLLVGRAVQGVSGAAVTAVSLSLIIQLFSTQSDRAKALGIYGFICAAGGGIGDLLGGVLSDVLSWHWIFLVNVPIGVVVYAYCSRTLPQDKKLNHPEKLDVAGALAITAALTLAVYTLVNAPASGWTSLQSWTPLLGSAALFLLFFAIEAHVTHPLVRLTLFRRRTFSLMNILGVLWAAGAYAWFVISPLYLQRILHYNPLQTGIAFLPATLVMGIFSAGLSEKLVTRLGVRHSLGMGMLLIAAGLTLFARAPINGTFWFDVLPGMLLVGMGGGMASTPLLLAAMSDVDEAESGLASGVVNTAFMMGGAVGLALLVGLAAERTDALQRLGLEPVAALNGGYHFAFLIGAMLALTAAAIGISIAPAAPHSTSPSEATPPPQTSSTP
jgi:EmrB/QacA subfamily drug resistance transporter